MPEHGGNLDLAMARYGGTPSEWIDLSTGINPSPYPLPDIPAAAWAALPTRSDLDALETAARRAYGTTADIVPLAGAQAAIQLMPRLRRPGCARILGPTYAEHAAALQHAGWQVETCDTIEALAGADLAVVVNPNNPDGRRFTPDALARLASTIGLLIVDESFVDAESGLSLASTVVPETHSIIILRSFGKFFGLAGLRLGFALAGADLADDLRALAGPWPVSGPAIAIARQALADTDWQAETIARLQRDAQQLDEVAAATGWAVVGGTPLFRTYDTGDAGKAQDMLARARIWSRTFSYADTWLRLGMPAGADQWARVEAALTGS